MFEALENIFVIVVVVLRITPAHSGYRMQPLHLALNKLLKVQKGPIQDRVPEELDTKTK